jgi:DNA-binding GntR family transcriptional regulator
VDEKRVIDKLRVSRTPFPEAIGILAKGGMVEIKPYRLLRAQLLPQRDCGSLRAIQAA